MKTLKKWEAFDVPYFTSIYCWEIYLHTENWVGGKNPELHKKIFPLLF